MVLDDIQLAKIINDRPNRKVITAAQEYSKKLLMHIKGIGLDAYIDKIDTFEKEDVTAIRKKYAVSNKAVFSRIHRPMDKVFSAKGGSVYYNLGDKNTAQFKDYLSNVINGFTLKQWLETFWMPAYGYDPMGLVMVEITEDGTKAYPTYRSIADIYEMQLNGRNVEYVIFKLDSKVSEQLTKAKGITSVDAIYRVVDDSRDRLIQINNGLVVDIKDEDLPNYFGRVPASVISNIYEPTKGMFISPDDAIIELADQFLREGSVKNIHKNYFGFPRAWEYQSACPDCKGTGVREGRACEYCKGTAIKSKSDPSETIRIPVPKDKDQHVIAPHLGGYITPDIEGWKMMSEELEMLEDLMFETKWGTHQADDNAKNETATGKFIDTQPVNDALNKYSDAEEMIETFITDIIGEFLYGLSYKGASITAGRRFNIETPDEIWKKLQDAIKNGAPTTALQDLYNDYLQSRYSSNAMEMQKLLKLAKVEPLPWIKFEEFARLQTFPDIILRRKYWYEGWLNSKTDPEILYTQLKDLQTDFITYCNLQDAALELDVQKNPTINNTAPPVAPITEQQQPAGAAA